MAQRLLTTQRTHPCLLCATSLFEKTAKASFADPYHEADLRELVGHSLARITLSSMHGDLPRTVRDLGAPSRHFERATDRVHELRDHRIECVTVTVEQYRRALTPSPCDRFISVRFAVRVEVFML